MNSLQINIIVQKQWNANIDVQYLGESEVSSGRTPR